MGIFHLEFFEEDEVYTCKQCNTQITAPHLIVSKNFHGQSGRAYLFNHVINVERGPAVDKQLATGKHRVRDNFCKVCLQIVGWSYDFAYNASEKYKEGKAVVEKAYMVKRSRSQAALDAELQEGSASNL